MGTPFCLQFAQLSGIVKVVSMFRIQRLLLLAAAGLCACATERTVTTNFQPKPRPDSEKTDAELMDALEKKFAGGFGKQTDKEGNTKMVSQKRSSFEGLRYNGDMSQIEKKAFQTTAFEKKQFDGASTRFETKTWDGVKSFTDGKLETPDFITHAKGVNTHSWQEASKQYATQQSDFQGRSWKEADKHLGHTINHDVETKRQNFGQPAIMSARQSQARTIQETREMMGRTD